MEKSRRDMNEEPQQEAGENTVKDIGINHGTNDVVKAQKQISSQQTTGVMVDQE